MLLVNPLDTYPEHVVCRMLDFFRTNPPWQRALWDVGTAVALREALEGSEAVREGALSQAALEWLKSSTQALVGRDLGVGDAAHRRTLGEALKPELRFGGHDWNVLKLASAELEAAYLANWSGVVADPRVRPGAERTARYLAGHLLDAGFSSRHLHRWLTYKTVRDPAVYSLPQLIAEAEKLIRTEVASFDVLIAFRSARPPRTGHAAAEWRSQAQVSAWLDEQKFSSRNLRQAGGWLAAVQARDPYSAVELAAETVDRLRARAALADGTQLLPHGQAWVAGTDSPVALRVTRGVKVSALHRELEIYSTDDDSRLGDSLQLLEGLDSLTSAPAVASGWAAVESLLAAPGDKEKVVAADRLAQIVACSFPRAELTMLSYAYAEEHADPLANALKAATSNLARCQLLADALLAGPVVFAKPSDRAAVTRMVALLASPSTVLRDVREHATAAFRRLYRQRNLVLHAGRIDAVALRAALRVAGPLVGAAFDRMAHAWYGSATSPRELAARAAFRLDTVGCAADALTLLER